MKHDELKAATEFTALANWVALLVECQKLLNRRLTVQEEYMFKAAAECADAQLYEICQERKAAT